MPRSSARSATSPCSSSRAATRPSAPPIAARDRAAGAALLVVGDADAWLANWALARIAREDAVIVVHGERREYRVFATTAELPPLLDDPVAQCWVLPPGERPRRATWPHPQNN